VRAMDWLVSLASVIALFAALAVARARARGRRAPVVITAPKVSFVNFGNGHFASLVSDDRSKLAHSFSQVVPSRDGAVPLCDILFVYATLLPDGSLVNAPGPTIRHVAAQARAAIVVLASPNPGENIVAAGRLPGPKKANLVFTIDRKEQFASFFAELFRLMASGKPLPLAWVTIAPQHLSAARAGTPDTIFLPEGNPVAFNEP
jgi:hypothetical protein